MEKLWLLFSLACLALFMLTGSKLIIAGASLAGILTIAVGILQLVIIVIIKIGPKSHSDGMGKVVCIILVILGLGNSFINLSARPVIIHDGMAKDGGWFMNPFTVDHIYFYPKEIRKDVTVLFNDHSVHVRAYTELMDKSRVLYYEYYGTPQALEDSLTQKVKQTMCLIANTFPCENDRQIVATANSKVKLRMWGLKEIHIVMPEDSAAFAYK